MGWDAAAIEKNSAPSDIITSPVYGKAYRVVISSKKQKHTLGTEEALSVLRSSRTRAPKRSLSDASAGSAAAIADVVAEKFEEDEDDADGSGDSGAEASDSSDSSEVKKAKKKSSKKKIASAKEDKKRAQEYARAKEQERKKALKDAEKSMFVGKKKATALQAKLTPVVASLRSTARNPNMFLMPEVWSSHSAHTSLPSRGPTLGGWRSPLASRRGGRTGQLRRSQMRRKRRSL